MTDGVAGVVEIIAPLEEACDVVLPHLHTDDSCSCHGHCDEAVGYLVPLTAAIVCPEIGDVCFEEGVDVVV